MIKNEIILKINIEDNNSKKRIINSFENFKREKPGWNLNNIEKKENEEISFSFSFVSIFQFQPGFSLFIFSKELIIFLFLYL